MPNQYKVKGTVYNCIHCPLQQLCSLQKLVLGLSVLLQVSFDFPNFDGDFIVDHGDFPTDIHLQLKEGQTLCQFLEGS